MNKNITKPLIIQFTPPEVEPSLKKSQKSIFVPVNTTWVQFRDNVLPLVSDRMYDSVLIHTRNDVDRDIKGVVGNMAIKVNALAGAGSRVDKPVLSYDSIDQPFYLMNPSKSESKQAVKYAPSDETIMERYDSYGSDAAWQEHQGTIWSRMKDMMPLSKRADRFNRDHAAQLKDPKRGLGDEDLDKFWSFKSGQNLSPAVMGDDMLGMPSVEGREHDGFVAFLNQPDGSVVEKPLTVRSLKTTGASGIAIPMANADGSVNKHQIAADLTPYGTVLHFRAADGKTVAKGELFDKTTREYAFRFQDGVDTHLKVTDVSTDNTITMQDTHGIFNVGLKKELTDVLKNRGYDIPGIITSIKAEQNGKYMWQSPGTMTGSDTVLKTVSPSNPGFIKAREPKNGEDKYVVLVAEGALKGHIVAKYVDVKDNEGVCFGDKIAGDKGIIVTQVPGVAEAYVKNALSIYEKYPVAGTYIAMDADGRENRNVALGIHSAYSYISKVSPTTVLSWDPAQKGMDDALLAVAQGRISIAQMGLVHGTPEQLFPLDGAKQMTPYTLDGKQVEIPSWLQEYREDFDIRQKRMAEMQKATAEREAMAKGDRKDASPEWVRTPENIENLRAATVAKSADMADAIAGKMPVRNQEPIIAHTPDEDELMSDKGAGQDPVLDPVLVEKAGRWDRENPEMPPIPVPEGYKSEYCYAQPVVEIVDKSASADEQLPFGNGTYVDHGGWGTIEVVTDHEMDAESRAAIKETASKDGYEPVGEIRLVSQSFTLDQEMTVQLSADDMPGKDGGQAL